MKWKRLTEGGAVNYVATVDDFDIYADKDPAPRTWYILVYGDNRRSSYDPPYTMLEFAQTLRQAEPVALAAFFSMRGHDVLTGPPYV